MSAAMTEADFDRRATDTLLMIEQAVEASGADIEFELAGGILTLEFTDGSKIIVNKQGAARQIWVAAKSGGFHYSYDSASARWVNSTGGGELFAELSRLASQQAGKTIRFD
jgi:CyaY protein